MKGNNSITAPSNNGCCDKGVTEITQKFVVEEETILVSEGGASSQTDEDIFE